MNCNKIIPLFPVPHINDVGLVENRAFYPTRIWRPVKINSVGIFPRNTHIGLAFIFYQETRVSTFQITNVSQSQYTQFLSVV